MSDQGDDLRTCPNCGQENASFTLRCIRCGQELEGLFELEGFDPAATSGEDQADETFTSAEVLASLEDNPLIADDDPDEGESSDKVEESDGQQCETDQDEPDWLERIRQRAREEEDAAGELAKGGIAMDDQRTKEGRKQVDEAFDEIMRRIREQNEREKARRSRRVESDLVDENGDPEWLRRIRELHPKQEDKDESIEPDLSKTDGFDDEWTEQELQELLQREMGMPEVPAEEPEEEVTTELSTSSATNNELEEEQEISEERFPYQDDEAGNPVIIHNIPEDEEELFYAEPEGEQPSDQIENEEPTEFPAQAEDELIAEEVSGSEEIQGTLGAEGIGSEEEEHENPQVAENETEEEPEQIAPAEKSVSTEEVLPDLLLLKNQRERAKVFAEIIGQEGRRTIAVLHENTPKGKLGRLVLGLLLVLAVLLAILLGPPGSAELPSSVPAAAFTTNLESVEADESVLIVLDYQAATRNDLEPLFKKVLDFLKEKGIQPRIVTANPENLWLAGDVLDASLLPLEYVPGGMLGYLALGVRVAPSWGELPMDQALPDEPDLFSGVDQVILVSDSAEFVRSWLEQVSTWRPWIETSAITTAVSAPMLLPYHDSGQLQGLVAGVTDAGAFSINQRAFQVGMLLMIVILLLGMIMKADEDAQKRAKERKR